MAYITREDGERFVIPSYRDILRSKKGAVLKKEILSLSQNYGEYAVIQKKATLQYEVAFSPDTGYLLGETVWHHFRRPFDMIYCEAIPNTTEVILVIVKSGSVYLDGTFSYDVVPEELVVFFTQQNNFEIFVYGDVPISKTPVDGKFSFDPAHVKAFHELNEPAFSKLPKLKNFQLQLVDVALRNQGIGVFPVKLVVGSVVAVGLVWMGWSYITSHKKALPGLVVSVANPFQGYISAMTSPAPALEIANIENQIAVLYSLPGWSIDSLDFSGEKLIVSVKSLGASADSLLSWAKQNGFNFMVGPEGFRLVQTMASANRPPPKEIIDLDVAIARLVDKISAILPGNNISVSGVGTKIGGYRQGQVIINFSNASVSTFDLIGKQLNDLPLVLSKVNIKFSRGNLTGTINLLMLGN